MAVVAATRIVPSNTLPFITSIFSRDELQRSRGGWVYILTSFRGDIMNRPSLSICLMIAVATACVMAASAFSQQQVELLVTIRSESVEIAKRISPTPVKLYHRLDERYVAGVSRTGYNLLTKRGIPLTIIDDMPWTNQYAIVAQSIDGPPVAGGGLALASGMDWVLIKASGEYFDALARAGHAIREISPEEIPFDGLVMHWRDPINPIPTIDSTIALVSDTSVRNYIQDLQNFGTRYWNNANRDSVARYLRAKFLQSGVTDVQIDQFQYSGTTQSNVVATLTGALLPLRELVVGGHHDSYSSNLSQAPGADDNASGTAAALEMARVLKLVDYQPNYTLRFMTYGAEEAGLRGSASYAQRARAANRDIRAMLNYDMIANRNQAQADRDVYIVWYTGSEALSNLHNAVARAYTTITPVLTTSYRSGSDSYSFWQQGYKSTFLIERDFSPYYHSPNDLLQYLDMPYCRDIIRAGLATLMTLDQMPPPVPGLSMRDRGDGRMVFASWDSVRVLDFVSYRVSIGRVPGIYDSSFTTTARKTYIGGLIEGQQYFVGVSIVDQAGLEGFITERSMTPRNVPLAPAGVDYERPGSMVWLKWRRNEEMDLAGYNIYRQSASTESFIKLNVQLVRDTVFTDSASLTHTHRYFVTAVDSTNNESVPSDTILVSPVTSLSDLNGSPFAFSLHQNYPNPFNPSTQITYELDRNERVVLEVYDVLGRMVEQLLDDTKQPGVYSIAWVPRNLASGTYYLHLKAGGKQAFRRMIFMK